MPTAASTGRSSKATRSPPASTNCASMPATICARRGAAARPAVPRRRADPLRHRRAGRALPRAAAPLALRLFDLPGKLSVDAPDDPLHPQGPPGRAGRRAADGAAPRLSARDRRRDAAPRKAAARATAAPARSRSGGCATASSSTSRSMPASCSSARSTAPRSSRSRTSPQADGTLHPVQAAMVEKHGSQCGFCTPGFVMALFALYQSTDGAVTRERGQRLDRRQPLPLHRLPADRRCRRSPPAPGRAATASASGAGDMTGAARLPRRRRGRLRRRRRHASSPRRRALDSLADLYEQHPDATIVAGATDVGLWITKQLRDLPKIIHVGRVARLRPDRGHRPRAPRSAPARPTPRSSRISRRIDPDLGELLRRLGSKQVRASGTVGGNVANGSPIGDTPPALIALGATVELRKGKQVALDAARGVLHRLRQAERASRASWSPAIIVPKLEAGHIFRCYKVSKRFDQDISSVMGAFRFTVDEDGRDQRGADRLWRHGGDAEAGERRRDGADRRAAPRLRAPGRGPSRRSARTSRRSTTTAPAPATAPRRRTRLLGKALIEAAGTAVDADPHRRPAREARPMELADIIAGAEAARRRPRSRSRTTARSSTSPAQALYIDDMPRAGRHAASRAGLCADRRRPRHGARPRAGARRAGRRRGAHRRRHPRQQRHQPEGHRRRPGDRAPSKVMFYGQVLFAVVAETRDQARRAARLAQDRDRAVDAGRSTSTMRSSPTPTVLPDYAFERGEPAEEIDARAEADHRRVPHRRAGAFLSRRPGRARHPRRGRRHARPFLDPAPDRGPARRRPRARRSTTTRSPSRCAAWAAASAARRARRRNGRRSPRSARGRPAGRARSASTATTT